MPSTALTVKHYAKCFCISSGLIFKTIQKDESYHFDFIDETKSKGPR